MKPPMERAEREARRDSFLGNVDDYRAARPGYPEALLEQAVSLGGLAPGASLIEVGCGTGEVTEWLVGRGFHVLALDRSADMTRLAADRLRAADGVDLRCADFESGEVEGRFDGLVAATSYHWLDPDTRARRCADALEPGGAIILLWHTHPRPFTGFFERSQALYRELVPEWPSPSTSGMVVEGIHRIIEELQADGLFTAIERVKHDWARTYDRGLFMRLLNTYSDHRLLPAATREELHRRLGEMIDRDFDGRVERPYRTELIVGRRAG